ncbi:MAG: hypothetical protein UY92_C0021G0019 [Candidatus Magasanikbacteria bacterium GW2011_GWA2_56_11]|uniref:Uncharacterized protein n=1 Tax=Candidatus Magasanikbacteria bacterium GW2011_GWA2_56_11 TaxID=1619044 RepID=A0A0G1YDW1_9BACT|nr:MAG: hypothetical protein UY92_C0021G0019 [Candidatus Magasanikbacteria bacterium GW2011_GWA2_56_11]
MRVKLPQPITMCLGVMHRGVVPLDPTVEIEGVWPASRSTMAALVRSPDRPCWSSSDPGPTAGTGSLSSTRSSTPAACCGQSALLSRPSLPGLVFPVKHRFNCLSNHLDG